MAGRLAAARLAVAFLAGAPARFAPAVLVVAPRLATAVFAAPRLAVLVFVALARFAGALAADFVAVFPADLVADLAAVRAVDFFAAGRDAVLLAPAERLVPGRVLALFVEAAFPAPPRPPVDFAVEAFFVAAIGTPPELE